MSNYSPAPGTPQTGAKAYAATAVAFIVIFVGAWIADDGGVTAKEVASWVLMSVIGSGLTGGAAYQTKNQPTSRRRVV